MHWQFHFRQVDSSEALKEYAQGQFERLENYLVADSRWKIHFGINRFHHEVEVFVHHPYGLFKVLAKSDISLYAAVDEAVEKLSKQFLKNKTKIQNHKKYPLSKQGRLERVNSLLEYDDRLEFQPYKRSA